MKKLFALILMGLCAQSFCMDREIGPDMGYAQGGSALVNIASNDSLAETLGDMERKYKALLRLVNHQGRNIRDLVRRNAAEGMERKYNALLRLVNLQDQTIRDLAGRNAAFEESVQTLDDK